MGKNIICSFAAIALILTVFTPQILHLFNLEGTSQDEPALLHHLLIGDIGGTNIRLSLISFQIN
jgi:hypothetical protein